MTEWNTIKLLYLRESKVLQMWIKLKIPIFLIVLFGQISCSSICLVKETQEAKNIEVIIRSKEYKDWGKDNENKLKSCTALRNFSYSQGFVWANYIPSFNINSKPSCLLKKAKNHAAHKESVFVIENSYHHFEAGLQYSVHVYQCPKGTEFKSDL